ncbi:MAG: hypothetical protein EVB11_05030 [Winogradskyella sp.]|nr:MAG: hypothetical protein EVB11_05030 [Winogradskyella sp.]
MITRKQKTEADNLALEYNMTMADALQLVLQSERNEILKRAFMLSDSDRYPSALESIAMKLGQEER